MGYSRTCTDAFHDRCVRVGLLACLRLSGAAFLSRSLLSCIVWPIAGASWCSWRPLHHSGRKQKRSQGQGCARRSKVKEYSFKIHEVWTHQHRCGGTTGVSPEAHATSSYIHAQRLFMPLSHASRSRSNRNSLRNSEYLGMLL